MAFTVTVRHGTTHQRYLTIDVDESDVRAALQALAAALPDDVAGATDLVEVRRSVDPEARGYLDEAPGDAAP